MQVDAAGRLWMRRSAEIKQLKDFADVSGLRWTSMWWAHQDSNLEPRDYESPALTVEL